MFLSALMKQISNGYWNQMLQVLNHLLLKVILSPYLGESKTDWWPDFARSIQVYFIMTFPF